MSVDAGIGLEAHFGRLENAIRESATEKGKPINRTVAASITTSGSPGALAQIQTIPPFPAHGRMWTIRSLGLFGVDDHSPVGNAGISNAGTVTNPGATTTIVSDGVLPPGTYDVSWQVSLQGTVTAADGNNMRLVSNGVNIATAIYPGVAGNYPQPTIRITVPPGSTATLIQSIAAASGASAIYGASITATPVAGLNVLATIYSGAAAEQTSVDATGVVAVVYAIPFFKDYGFRHLVTYPGESIYCNIFNPAANQVYQLVAIVDEYIIDEVDASRI